MPKKNYVSGFGEKDPDAADFLRPSQTDPFMQGGHSTVGYNAKFNDTAGTYGKANQYGTDPWGDNSEYTGYGTTHSGDRDYPHERLGSLVDDDTGMGSGNKLTGGGGPLTKGRDVGAGSPRFAPKNIGTKGQVAKGSKGGVNR